MKKIFYLLLLSFFFCNCQHNANTNGTKENPTPITQSADVYDTLSNSANDTVSLDESHDDYSEIFASRVHRISQKNILSNQGCRSVPLVLLDNGDILSEDEDVLYFLRPGDSVYYSNDGYIIEVVYADKKTKGRS